MIKIEGYYNFTNKDWDGDKNSSRWRGNTFDSKDESHM